MGLIGKLLKTSIHVATTPFDAAKDLITLGGSITNERSSLEKKVEKLKNDLKEIEKEVEKL